MTKEERIIRINQALAEYFSNAANPRTVQAKDLMPLFIRKGIFNSDHKNGLPIRKFLRELDELNALSVIPYVNPDRKSTNTNWYFTASRLRPTAKKEVVDSQVSAVKKSMTQKTCGHGRQDSDEYYVISLCNKVLGKTASQQHKFDFLRGDSGTMLPVDAYYEDLNLVVEYYERQHTESVKLFDRRMTVSGVGRGEQRRIYDERRRKLLPEHGIKLVVIDYSDFGSSKKLARNIDNDTETVKRILSANGVL